MKARRLVVVAALALVVLSPTAAGTETVLNDKAWDYSWNVAGTAGPVPAEPVRDAAFEWNGSAADIREVRVGENATHIWIELELGRMPPEPEECAGPPGARDAADCNYMHQVFWAFYSDSPPRGPQMWVSWNVGCTGPACNDTANFFLEAAHTAGAHRGFDFDRVPPSTGRWTLHKKVMHEDSDFPDGGPARLCEGDALLNFRADTLGFQPTTNTYEDRRDTTRTGLHVIQHDSPGCPEPTTNMSGPVASPATVPLPDWVVVLSVAAAAVVVGRLGESRFP